MIHVCLFIRHVYILNKNCHASGIYDNVEALYLEIEMYRPV